MAYYQLTIENEQLSLTKNRKSEIIFQLVILAVVLGVLGGCMIYGSTLGLNAIIVLLLFAGMYAIFVIRGIRNTLQDADMVIIRKDAQHFCINGDSLVLNTQSDYLDAYITHTPKGPDRYTISIITADESIEIMSGLDPGEYERYSVRLSDFLGLPRRIRRSWWRTQARKLFRISDEGSRISL